MSTGLERHFANCGGGPGVSHLKQKQLELSHQANYEEDLNSWEALRGIGGDKIR